MKALNFAIIGTNFISDLFVSAAKQVPFARVSAVYSRTEERAEYFSKKHGGMKRYTALSDLLNDMEIDAVYIASPNICHFEHATAALKAGKHVLCEKQIAVSYAEFKAIRELAAEKGLILLEAMRPDFDELFSILKNKLSALGKIKEARLEFCQYSSRYDKFKEGIIENAFCPEMKNSSLADIGIYPLHLSISLFGVPCEFSSSSSFLGNGFEAEGMLSLLYDGFSVGISYSKIREGENISCISGENGSAVFDKINAPYFLEFCGKDGEMTEKYERKRDNMEDEIRIFCDMVFGACDNTPYLDITEECMKITDEIIARERFPHF